MPLLQPTEDQSLIRKRKMTGMIIAKMRTRSSSSSRASSVISIEGSNESEQPVENATSEALTEESMRELNILGEKLAANTRSMMSLEKSILTLASAVTTLTRTMRTEKRPEQQPEQLIRSCLIVKCD